MTRPECSFLARFAPAVFGGARGALHVGLALLFALAPETEGRTGADGPGQAEYRITTWETADGLPESSATAMVQDADGYLWFGTFGGLVRFNGDRFDAFNQDTTPELPGSGVVNLWLDGAGRMLVSTFGGVAVRDEGVWRRLGRGEGWVGDYARSSARRADGAVLVTTFDGHVLEWSGGRFRELPRPAPGQPSCVAAADGSGRWWVSRPGFVGWWDGDRWHAVLEGVSEAVCGTARDGGVWVVTRKALTKYRADSEVSRVELPMAPGGLWSLHEDSEGNVWVCTFDRGVVRISPDGSMRRWDTGSGLSSDGVRFVFEDRERSIWVGTNGGGLTRFTRERVRTLGPEAGIEEPVIKAVAPSHDGGMLVASFGRGLFRVAGERAEPIAGELPARILQSVIEDRAGRVWVGTYGGGLWQVSPGAVRKVPPAMTGGANVIALYEDTAGRLWVAGGQGVGVLTGDTWLAIGQQDGLPPGGVVAFAEDATGGIWVSNTRGVYRYDGGTFAEVRDERGEGIRGILCFLVDEDGSVWMGSASSGLIRWREGKLVRIGENAGLPVPSACAIADDGRGYWWIASNCGIARASAAELRAAADGKAGRLRFQWLGLEDGMASVECTGGRQPVTGRDDEGRLWFATVRGVVRVDPAAFQANDIAPTSRVESLGFMLPVQGAGSSGASRGTEQHRIEGAALADGVVLPAGSRRIELRYAGLSFADPRKVRFEVKLEPMDAEWQSVGGMRSVTYYDLPTGRYNFRVRAANNDGLWEQQGSALSLAVLPYFWQTSWFRGGAGLGLLGVSAGAAWWAGQLRHRRRRREDERFRLAIEAAPNVMLMVDPGGRITMANSRVEREFGYNRDALIGQRADLLVPEMPDLRRAHAQPRDEMSDRPPRADQELFGLARDGRRFPVEVSLSTVHSAEGDGVLASIVDISERVRMELAMTQQRSELAHLARVTMLGELSGSLAHELNQPLTAILSNAQAAQRIMARAEIDTAEVREILADIVDQDKRAGEVINRLRALLRHEETRHEPLDLREVVREVLRLMRSDLINRRVEVETDLPPDLPVVLGDRVQLQQVLLNLLMNGCDAIDAHAGAERRLTLRVDTGGGAVRVSVGDTGPGIAPEMADRLFKPFNTSKADGMGLGLAVCHTILGAHHGEIWGENNPGVGATFTFAVPVRDG